MSTAYKETKDEFEDPDLETKRIYIAKLFSGAKDWNFGLFVQEIFKREYKVFIFITFDNFLKLQMIST